MYNLGLLKQAGRGCDVNFTEAARYYKLATQQGSAAAQYVLGWCYHLGNGVEFDDSKAVDLWHLSSKQGKGHAAEVLGRAYEKGWSVEVNIVEAMRYYRQAVASKSTTSFASHRVLKLADEYKEAVSTALLCALRHSFTFVKMACYA